MSKLQIAQKLSAPFVARFALKFARSPKRIKKWATHINARIDIPGMTEDQEQVFYEKTLGTVLDTVAKVIDGQPILTAISLRDTTRDALVFLRDYLNTLDATDEAFDIPFLPDWMEDRGIDMLIDFIDDHAIPWVDTTPRLQ